MRISHTLTLYLFFRLQRQLSAVGWLVGLNFNPKPQYVRVILRLCTYGITVIHQGPSKEKLDGPEALMLKITLYSPKGALSAEVIVMVIIFGS